VSLAVSAADRAALDRAFALAVEASAEGDVPVGAVVVAPDGRILGEGRNLRERTGDPTAHAEIVALREAAAARGSWHLEDCTLVVTLEPCLMCAGAVLQARLPRLVFAAWDAKAGAAGSVYDVVRDRRLPYRVEVVGGVDAERSERMLRAFFDERR
jgi:tRNA(adenine34) deaminase